MWSEKVAPPCTQVKYMNYAKFISVKYGNGLRTSHQADKRRALRSDSVAIKTRGREEECAASGPSARAAPDAEIRRL